MSRLSEFVGQNLSNIAWAYAALGCRDEPLLHAIASQARRRNSELSERDLAALAWSFATLGFANVPLMQAISAEASRNIGEFAPRSLANIAWAFATLGYGHGPFLNALAAAVLRKISASVDSQLRDTDVDEFITNLKALAWALNFSRMLPDDLDLRIHDALVSLAKMRDAWLMERIAHKPLPHPPSLPSREVFVEQSADPDRPPRIIIDLPELCVVHKPPGWEVDCADVGSGILLSTFLQQRFTVQQAPLVHFEEHQFGMVHRLDRVSSGLLLIGKTFLGFHVLNWQLNTGRLEREYVVLVHGWVSPSLRVIDANVFHVHAEGYKESQVTEQGKPSQTQLTTLGHYTLRGHEDERLSIVVIQIRTGRRHQIRTHLSYVQHPTVADGKYMAREQFVRDKQWCQRNFLHRYRLGFRDCSGHQHEAIAPLPEDLCAALSHLVPAGPRSASTLEEWAGTDHGRSPKAWHTYEGLPDESSV